MTAATTEERHHWFCGACGASAPWFPETHDCPVPNDDADDYVRGMYAGARGRGSRARYRRAVEQVARECSYMALVTSPPNGFLTTYEDVLGRRHEVGHERSAWHARATARCRRILSRLDGAR